MLSNPIGILCIIPLCFKKFAEISVERSKREENIRTRRAKFISDFKTIKNIPAITPNIPTERKNHVIVPDLWSISGKRA